MTLRHLQMMQEAIYVAMATGVLSESEEWSATGCRGSLSDKDVLAISQHPGLASPPRSLLG